MKPTCLAVLLLLALPWSAAAEQTCGGKVVADSVSRCPDGSIPVYRARTLEPAQPAQPAQPAPRPPVRPAEPASPPQGGSRSAAGLDAFFGVWRTNVSGAVWTSPTGYDGTSWLHVSTGVSAGDLIVKPDGTYVWASYGGKTGRWERGDAESPIVLVDTVENRRWNVSVNGRQPQQIFVWDGVYSYDGRR